MNGDQNQSKDSAIKTLAIIGFTSMIIFGVWLAVQVVQIAPSAFNSLASLSESVYGKPKVAELTVVTSKSVVNNNESFELMWNDSEEPGSYQFSYVCTDGVVLSTSNADGELVPIACEVPFTLSGNGSTEMKIISEEERFIDIGYSLAFVRDGETEAYATDVDKVTVVNASIPQSGLIAGVQETEETEVTEETEEVVENTEVEAEPVEKTTESTTESEVAVTPTPAPAPQYEFTYQLPVSNPNGFVDLKISYLGVGEILNNRFVARSTIDNDVQGAVQFSVKNIGTKTSDDWTYEVLLPNGETFRSTEQKPLKPQEIATIALGFNAENTGTKAIKGEVETAGDIVSANNNFSWSVVVTN